MRTAEDAVPDFHTVSEDPASAMSAQQGHRLDRTLETVERPGFRTPGDRECFVVVVAAGITDGHQTLLVSQASPHFLTVVQVVPRIFASTRFLVRDELHEFPDPFIRKVPGDIGLGQNADEVVSVDDRQPAYLVFLHGHDGHVDLIIGADGHGFALP